MRDLSASKWAEQAIRCVKNELGSVVADHKLCLATFARQVVVEAALGLDITIIIKQIPQLYAGILVGRLYGLPRVREGRAIIITRQKGPWTWQTRAAVAAKAR